MNKNLLTVSAVLVTAASFFAQDKKGLYEKVQEFKPENAPAFVLGKYVKSQNLTAKSEQPTLKLLKSENGANGFSHYRYQQTLNGYPVEGATVIQHVKNGKLLYQNGEIVEQFTDKAKATKSSKLSESAALEAAKRFIGASSYKWEVPGEDDFLKRETGNPNASFKPKGELVYYAPGSEFDSQNLRLAYKFDIYAQAPVSRNIVYVDAENGNILGTEEKIKHLYTAEDLKRGEKQAEIAPAGILANAAGNATTAYSGVRSITTDFTGTTYRLRETGRGNGIETYNLRKGTSYTGAVDFTDTDNNWNNVNTALDQYATDAHWGSEMVYDFYKNTLNRNGIDNAGMKMLSYVHYSSNYVNAFWDGSRMTYGDGNATYKPLVSIDIVGHEMTHGVTERSSNLAYRSESGALNEAYSDILGVAVDFWARPTQGNWLMGEEIGSAFRSMSNPNAYNQPDTYKGTKWVNTVGCTPTQSNDQCGVHTNSGVLNYWFYLLSNGGSDTNDIGSAFSVSGIGISKATAIAYRTNTVYLTSSSTYADARTYSIKSAEDLYGVGSNEANQVMNAFYAVGIGAAASGGGTTPTCTAPSGLTSTSITTSGATVSWTAVSGATGYTLEYKPSTSTTYTVQNVTGTSATLSGLTSTTLYDWRVKTTCSATSTSAYTSAQFTTAGTSTSCNGAYEPNNSTTAATAITALNTDYKAAVETTTDNDYYKITFTAGGQFTVKLSGLTHDVDMKLYSSAGTLLKTSQNSGTTAEKIQYTGTATTYYIRVYPYSGSSPNSCYTLRVEPGYTVAGISAGETDGENYSLYPNPAVDFINVNVPEKLMKNTTVYVYDMSGNLRQTSKLNNGNKQLNITKLDKGIYTAKVDTGDGEPMVMKFIKN